MAQAVKPEELNWIPQAPHNGIRESTCITCPLNSHMHIMAFIHGYVCVPTIQ